MVETTITLNDKICRLGESDTDSNQVVRCGDYTSSDFTITDEGRLKQDDMWCCKSQTGHIRCKDSYPKSCRNNLDATTRKVFVRDDIIYSKESSTLQYMCESDGYFLTCDNTMPVLPKTKICPETSGSTLETIALSYGINTCSVDENNIFTCDGRGAQNHIFHTDSDNHVFVKTSGVNKYCSSTDSNQIECLKNKSSSDTDRLIFDKFKNHLILNNQLCIKDDSYLKCNTDIFVNQPHPPVPLPRKEICPATNSEPTPKTISISIDGKVCRLDGNDRFVCDNIISGVNRIFRTDADNHVYIQDEDNENKYCTRISNRTECRAEKSSEDTDRLIFNRDRNHLIFNNQLCKRDDTHHLNCNTGLYLNTGSSGA